MKLKAYQKVTPSILEDYVTQEQLNTKLEDYVTEAPVDDKLYARKNKTWADISQEN